MKKQEGLVYATASLFLWHHFQEFHYTINVVLFGRIEFLNLNNQRKNLVIPKQNGFYKAKYLPTLSTRCFSSRALKLKFPTSLKLWRKIIYRFKRVLTSNGTMREIIAYGKGWHSSVNLYRIYLPWCEMCIGDKKMKI